MDAAAREEREQRWRRRMLLWLLLLLLVLIGSLLPRAFARGEPVPAPTITQAPSATTASTLAVFAFVGTGPFECALDGAAFAPCTSSVRYEGLAPGRHVFLVRSRARDVPGATAAHHWRIVPSSALSRPAPQPARAKPPPVRSPSSPGTIVPIDASSGVFSLSGDVQGSLAPGVARALPLVVSNPNDFPIEVTEVVVTVAAGSSRPGCDGPANLDVAQAGADGAVSLVIAARASVTLPAQGVAAPIVRMRNLPSNQDACKSARFTLLYDGAALEAGV